MLCSHASELALRAALYLTLQPPGKLTPVREIAKGTGLPGPYLAKIMRRLIDARLVRAFRGPGGGVRLRQAPEAVNLAALVRAMEGPVGAESCVLGLRPCSSEHPCSLHGRWTVLRAAIQDLLKETTLASLAQNGAGSLSNEHMVMNGKLIVKDENGERR